MEHVDPFLDEERTSWFGYDPRAHGAKCDTCPLRGKVVVPPERHENDVAIVIGETPGEEEELEGRPFVGKSGIELTRGLEAVGVRRDQVAITNTLLCRVPPPGKLEPYLQRIHAKGLPSPIACCAPRLLRELADFQNVVPVGNFACKAVIPGLRKGVMAVRGNFIESVWTDGEGNAIPGTEYKVLPTVHPAFVLRNGRWRHVFRQDLGRAFRWFRDALIWTDPVVTIRPEPADLERWLWSTKWKSWDLETTMEDPLYARIYCVGFGSPSGDEAYVVPLLSKDGQSHFYTERDQARVIDICKRFLLDPSRRKVGWNSNYFDRIVVESRWGITPVAHYDLIVAHRAVHPDMPHSLAFAGSYYTDVRAWKEDHEGNKLSTHAKDDRTLHLYNAKDDSVTARITKPIIEGVVARAQVGIVEFDHEVQGLCVGLHRVGMPVDQAARLRHDVELTEAAVEWAGKAAKLFLEDKALCDARMADMDLGGTDFDDDSEDDFAEIDPASLLGDKAAALKVFNPGSPNQVREVLFRRWGLLPPSTLPKKVAYTESGDESTCDDVLIALWADASLTPDQHALIWAVRRYRRQIKYLGTYVRQVRFAPGEKGCIVHPDGRIHVDWNAHSVVTGRLSSHPNAQNWPHSLRDIIAAPKGMVFVGADMDQIELRVAAALACDERFLQVFAEGGDPHAMTGHDTFGGLFRNAEGQPTKENPKGSGTYKRIRDVCKQLNYLFLYGGKGKTAHRTLISAEDKKGNLIFTDLKREDVELYRDRFLAKHPCIPAWWDENVIEVRQQGYLAEPVLGRRRDFSPAVEEDDEFNEIQNFKVQAAMSAVVSKAALELAGKIPFDFAGKGTGLFCYVHDSLDFLLPHGEAKRIMPMVTEAMTRTEPGIPGVTLTCEIKVGKNWMEV